MIVILIAMQFSSAEPTDQACHFPSLYLVHPRCLSPVGVKCQNATSANPLTRFWRFTLRGRPFDSEGGGGLALFGNKYSDLKNA